MSRLFIYFVSLSILIVVVMCSLLFVVKPQTTLFAKTGVMDIRDHDFKSDGCIELLGEWAFHWNQAVNEETYNSIVDQTPDLYAPVPAYWDKLSRIDSRIKPRGVATYSLRILKNFGDETDTLAIRTYNTTPNADIYVDGRKISEIGDVDANHEKSVPANKSVLVPVKTRGDSMTIAIGISNYHNANGGLNRPICIGPYEDLLAMREKSLAIDSIFLGGLFIMVLYQFSILIIRKKRIASLYLGLLALFSFFFAGLKGEMALLTISPNWGGEFRSKIIFLVFSLAGPVFALYYSKLYPVHFHSELRWFILPVALITIPAVVFTPMEIHSRFIFPLKLITTGFIIYTFSMLILALYRTGDLLIMLVLFGMEMLIFNIALGVVDNRTQTIFQSIAGPFFVFGIYQTVLEARICSNAFAQVDKLSVLRRRLERQNTDFFTQIFVDTKTGTYNKVLLNNFLQSKWTADNLDNKKSISMILLDIDHFELYMDIYGQEQSENLIVRLSQIVRQDIVDMECRVLVRYGKDTLGVVLTGIDVFHLYRRADRLRTLIESEKIKYSFAGNSRILTISVGCATLSPSKDNKPETLIDLTNRALKLAKRNGRNLTEIVTV